jgi:hypothetical protein
VFREVGDDELAVLVIHGYGRTQKVVALTDHTAHVLGVATSAVGVIKFLTAEQDILRCERANELREFVRASAGRTARACRTTPAAATSTGTASAAPGGRNGGLLRYQQNACSHDGKAGSYRSKFRHTHSY